jgi:hypothetical protein
MFEVVRAIAGIEPSSPGASGFTTSFAGAGTLLSVFSQPANTTNNPTKHQP